MRAKSMVEKFSEEELSDLRNELRQSGLDNWQAAELLSRFLAVHGYGVNPIRARDAVTRMEGPLCSFDRMQAELERVAMVA